MPARKYRWQQNLRNGSTPEKSDSLPTHKEKRYTPWHPLLTRTLAPLVPSGAALRSELQLNLEPPRVDIVIECENPRNLEPAPCLRSIFDRLNNRTLIEFKSPLDRLDGETLSYVLSCAHRYEILEDRIQPSGITILVIADRLTRPFRAKAEQYGGRLLRAERGIWQVDNLAFRLYTIEARIVGKKAGERPLSLFSTLPAGVVRRLAGRTAGWERALFQYISRQLELLLRKEDVMALEDYPFFRMTERERLLAIRDVMSIEDRLEGVPPEERLKGVPPEERLKGVPPEERLRGLPPDVLLRALDQVMTPELAQLLKERLH